MAYYQRRWTDENLVLAVKESRSMRQCLQRIGINCKGGNYRTVKNHIIRLGLDSSHWYKRSWNKGVLTGPRKSLSQILVKGSRTLIMHRHKQRLISEGILTNKCAVCELTEWNGKPLVLHLDHKNGDPSDNRLENLQLLCPNCDSQTSTYRGRNIAALKI